MTIPEIAPYNPTLRTMTLCSPQYNGSFMAYLCPNDGAIHLDMTSVSNVKIIEYALKDQINKVVWVELVHCEADDHDQLSAVFWNIGRLVADVANPDVPQMLDLLDWVGVPGELAVDAVSAAENGRNVIVYMMNDTEWAHYTDI